MIKSLALFSILFFASTMIVTSQNVYPFEHNGKNYEVVKEMKSFMEAAADAVAKGGHLVHVDDASENSAIYSAVVSGAGVPVDYTVVNDGGGIAYIWLGATDKYSEGTWLWDGDADNVGENFWNGEGNNGAGGGSSVEDAYHNWGGSPNPNEPDNYNDQDAAAMGLEGWPAGSGTLGNAIQWNDIDISNSLYYVIEYESSAVSTQSINYIEVYPNPFKDQINIENVSEKDVEITLRIFDLTGKILVEQQSRLFNEYSINLTDIDAGIYLLYIIDPENNTWIQKIEKN